MIELYGVRFSYPDFDVSLEASFPAKAITAVIGPSGCGKTTLLNLIAGFESPTAGRIMIGSHDVTDLPPAQRPVSVIFQDNNVFPHLDLWQNVALGLSPSLKLNAEQKEKVEAVLAKTGLLPLAKKKPGEISGGERQRVAIARALLRKKPVLLLDEPFAALGPALRREMLVEVMRLCGEQGLTAILVSHQPEDALYAAAFTAFMSKGQIVALKPTAALFADKALAGLEDYLGSAAKT